MYQMKEWLFSDIVSGVSTGLVAVLQGEEISILSAFLLHLSVLSRLLLSF